MARVYKLPIADTADSSYRIVVEGNTYLFRFRWNTYDESWQMYLGLAGEDPVIKTKIVNGNDLLKQYRHLEGVPDAALFCVDIPGVIGRPGRNNIGIAEGKRFNMVLVTKEE